jgi:hypothetical protein
LARAVVGAFLGFLEAVRLTFDGEDLGVVDEAGNTSRHSAKGRLVVTTVLLCS